MIPAHLSKSCLSACGGNTRLYNGLGAFMLHPMHLFSGLYFVMKR